MLIRPAQQPPGRGRRDGHHVVPAVAGRRRVELLPQRPHQQVVRGVEPGPLGVGLREVERVAGLVVRRRVLVVDVDAVEPVRAQERHDGVGEGVDAGRVDAAVRVGRHPVEAAAVDPAAVVAEVATGLGPAADADERLHLRVLLLELVEQVEVPGVGVAGIHLRPRHPGPRHVRRRVVRRGRGHRRRSCSLRRRARRKLAYRYSGIDATEARLVMPAERFTARLSCIRPVVSRARLPSVDRRVLEGRPPTRPR